MTTTAVIEGHVDHAFREVGDFLRAELTTEGAVGQAIAVAVRGRLVVDLWGGHADAGRNRPWSSDTLACLFSAGKPLAAVAALKLVDQGRLALDQAVMRYWPEFGKPDVTVRHVLAHLAALPIAEAAPPRSVYDRAILIEALERQKPLWQPGGQGCFHSFTYGVLVGEIVRRVSGMPFPDFFRAEIAKPLALDLVFALSPAEQRRCANLILVDDNPLLHMMRDPETLLGRSWQPLPWNELNSADFRGCDFPSLAGHGTARGLARFYSIMASGGAADGQALLSSSIVTESLTEQWHHHDPFFGAPLRMGLGFTLSNPLLPFTGGARSFAQPGLGGVIGLGDADTGLGLGVTVNRMSGGIDNRRLQELVAIVTHRL